MTIRANSFTPEVMLSSPRRSPGIPNKDGSLVIFSVSSWDFALHKKTSEVRLLDVKANQSKVLADDAKFSSIVWVDEETVAMLKSTDEGATELIMGNIKNFQKTSYVVGNIDAAASELKITQISDGHYGMAISAPVAPDGSLFNAAKQPEKHSSGRLYKSLFVRHWDHWIEPSRKAVWFGAILKSADSRYFLASLTNALKGVGIECPIDDVGREGDFDIGTSGIIFVARDPVLIPALNTKVNLYLIPLTTFLETNPTIHSVNMSLYGMEGSMSSPTFSKDGKSAAFLVKRQNGYESDRNRLFIMPDVSRASWLVERLHSWDLSPSSIEWSADGSMIYMTAECRGRSRIYSLPRNPRVPGPALLESIEGSILDVKSLQQGDIFATGSSFTDNGMYIIYQSIKSNSKVISSASHNGMTFGLSRSQVEEIWFEGAEGARVHAWVLKPSNFEKPQKYPLALLVHGGPQGAWLDQWATRWNPAVFAEQGYVVVCPNPTGSTGYGQTFTDAINQQWGGRPYEDLVSCFEYVKKNLTYVDTNNAVALGASYGGYMMNWMQGHDLGRKFKALVCHDGIFSTLSALSTEELYFVYHDIGATWSENKKNYQKWDPAQFTQNWKTPMLIIHSELDYRLPISEGLAAFNILQTQGVDSEFLSFPDENHFILKEENALKWYIAILNFINRYTGLPPYREGDLDDIIQDPLQW